MFPRGKVAVEGGEGAFNPSTRRLPTRQREEGENSQFSRQEFHQWHTTWGCIKAGPIQHIQRRRWLASKQDLWYLITERTKDENQQIAERPNVAERSNKLVNESQCRKM